MTLKGLWLQRDRWQRGLWRSFFTHYKMLFNPKYGKTGMIGFPYYFFFEILGPVVEGIAYLAALYVVCSGHYHVHDIFYALLMAWSYIFLITLSCAFLNYLTYRQYRSKKALFVILGLTGFEVLFIRPYRAIDAVYSTLRYGWNRLLGRPL